MIIVGECKRGFLAGDYGIKGGGIVVGYPVSPTEPAEEIFITLPPVHLLRKDKFVGLQIAVKCQDVTKNPIADWMYIAIGTRVTTADKAAELISAQ